jgi:nitrous oxidase accessory protein
MVVRRKTAPFVCWVGILSVCVLGIVHTEAATIRVPDDHSTIQEAVDAANSGDIIIVRDGTYTENVDVNKGHIAIRSENGPNSTVVRADNSNDPAFEIAADFVDISGFTVKGAFSYILSHQLTPDAVLVRIGGICLKECEYCSIFNNVCSDNSIGIQLDKARRNLIYENNCSDNEVTGIYLAWHCRRNTVRRNTCVSNGSSGIYLEASKDNTVTGNICSGNRTGICLYSPQSSFVNLTLDNVVVGNTLSNNEQGINLYVSRENTVKENEISNNQYGIVLNWSENDTIYRNNFVTNGRDIKFGTFGYVPSPALWSSPVQMSYTYKGNEYTNYLGNYWAAYAGSDSDGDGIGDSAYNIDSDKDNYPLKEPFENYIVVMVGDLDGDGDVDFADYAVLTNQWMNQNCSDPQRCDGADLNTSGSVDLRDLAEFAGNWPVEE